MDWSSIGSVLTLPATIVAAVVTWILTRKKQHAETDSSIATGANTAVTTMLTVMTELRKEILDLYDENEKLKARVHELEALIVTLQKGLEDVD